MASWSCIANARLILVPVFLSRLLLTCAAQACDPRPRQRASAKALRLRCIEWPALTPNTMEVGWSGRCEGERVGGEVGGRWEVGGRCGRWMAGVGGGAGGRCVAAPIRTAKSKSSKQTAGNANRGNANRTEPNRNTHGDRHDPRPAARCIAERKRRGWRAQPPPICNHNLCIRVLKRSICVLFFAGRSDLEANLRGLGRLGGGRTKQRKARTGSVLFAKHPGVALYRKWSMDLPGTL